MYSKKDLKFNSWAKDEKFRCLFHSRAHNMKTHNCFHMKMTNSETNCKTNSWWKETEEILLKKDLKYDEKNKQWGIINSSSALIFVYTGKNIYHRMIIKFANDRWYPVLDMILYLTIWIVPSLFYSQVYKNRLNVIRDYYVIQMTI